jgi:hypothetical protein
MIYGALATGCGYPYPVIDAMTLAEVGEIFAYWRENPPAHLMVQTIARMLGWKPAEDVARSLDEVAAMAPPGLSVAPRGDINMPAPVLDIETLRARNHAQLANRAKRL